MKKTYITIFTLALAQFAYAQFNVLIYKSDGPQTEFVKEKITELGLRVIADREGYIPQTIGAGNFLPTSTAAPSSRLSGDPLVGGELFFLEPLDSWQLYSGLGWSPVNESPYLLPAAADPTTRDDGSPLQEGDTYYNTSSNENRIRIGSSWVRLSGSFIAFSAPDKFAYGGPGGATVEGDITSFGRALVASSGGNDAKEKIGLGGVIGPAASDPSTRLDGSPLKAGDTYYDTTADFAKWFDGSVWRTLGKTSVIPNAQWIGITGHGGPTLATISPNPFAGFTGNEPEGFGVTGDDGKIYYGPTGAAGDKGFFAVFDPSTNTATETDFGGSWTSNTMIGYDWPVGVMGPDPKKLYFAPKRTSLFLQTAPGFLVVDTDAGTVTEKKFGLTMEVGGSVRGYNAGVLGKDDNLYFFGIYPPTKIDLGTGIGTQLTSLGDEVLAAVVGKDEKIYAFGDFGSQIITKIFDIDTQSWTNKTYTDYGISSMDWDSDGYVSAAMNEDGLILVAPHSSEDYLVIDSTAVDTAWATPVNQGITQQMTMKIMPDGKSIAVARLGANDLDVIRPAPGTARKIKSFSGAGYWSISLGSNGKLYLNTTAGGMDILERYDGANQVMSFDELGNEVNFGGPANN